MSKNPLKELLKSDGREQVYYDPRQEALSPRIQTGGNYRVVVQQTPKTNSLAKFANALKGGAEVYGNVVDANQQQAVRDIQTMSDEEFDKHYNELIQGDKSTRSVFGYNKAFQQAIVERTYKEIVPTELQDIENDFEKSIQDFDSIAEYDEAVSTRIDSYMNELGERFNQNVFAQEAHNVLASGKSAKLKLTLHDKYEQKAREYISTKIQDDLNSALQGSDDTTDFQTLFTDSYNSALTRLDGDKSATNALFLKSTQQHVINQLNSQTEQGLANAEDIIEAVYDQDEFNVGGKPIFDTQEGAKIEGELRASLNNSRTNLPILIQQRAQKTLDEYYFKYFQAEGDSKKLQEVDEEFDELLAEIPQEEAMRLRLLNEGREQLKVNPALFREEAFTKFYKSIPNNPELDFSNDFVISNIGELGLEQEQIELFYKRNADDKYALTPLAYSLSSELYTMYDSEYRRLAREIFDDKTLNVDEREARVKEAQIIAKQKADKQLVNLIKQKADVQQEVIGLSDKEQAKWLNQGWTPSQIAEFELIEDEDDKAEYIKEITELNEISTDTFEREEGALKIKGGYNKKKLTKNWKESLTTQDQAFKDDQNFLDNWFALTGGGHFSATENSKIPQLIKKGKRQEALEFIWSRKEVTGFTEEELISGIVDVNTDTIAQRRLSRGTMNPDADPLDRQRKITVESILIQDRDVAGDPRKATLAEIPITLKGGMRATVEALRNDDVEAYAQIAEKYGMNAQELFNLQKKYFIDHKFISDVEMGDDEDNDLDPDPEKKTLEDNEVEAIDSDITENFGKYGLADEPTNIHEQVLDKYNLRTQRGKIFIDYKDFAKQFYTSRLPNANPEAIDRIVDAKFKLLEQRSPELLNTKNNEVRIVFKDLGDNIGGFSYRNRDLIEVSDRYKSIEALESTIMHELVHASQKNRKGTMTNLMTNERINKGDYTSPDKSYMDYLNSPSETDARLAEVARRWVLKGNEFIDPRKGTEVAEDALVDFLAHRGDDEFDGTRVQLFRMLGFPDRYIIPFNKVKDLPNKERALWLGRGYSDESRIPMERDKVGEEWEEKVRQELRKNPNLELILESIGTLVQNESTQNPNKQIT